MCSSDLTVLSFVFLIAGCSFFFPNEAAMQGQNAYYEDDDDYQYSSVGYLSGPYIGGGSSAKASAHNEYGKQHKIPSSEKYKLVLSHSAQQSKHQAETQTNHKPVESQTQASTRQTKGQVVKPNEAQTQSSTGQTNGNAIILTGQSQASTRQAGGNAIILTGQSQASTRQTGGNAAKQINEERQQEYLRNQQQMQNNYQQQQQNIQAAEQQKARTEILTHQIQIESTKNAIAEMQNNYQQQQRQNEYASGIAHKVQETNYQVESNVRKVEYEVAQKKQEQKKHEEEQEQQQQQRQQAVQNQIHQIQMQQAIQSSGFHFPGR